MSRHDPEHYPRGTRVKPSRHMRGQGMGRASDEGTVTSSYPDGQTVMVKWDRKKNSERVHVDLLDRIE